MSLKFTNEPPQGIRASLKRTYADITQDTLDYSNHPSWPMLLYAVAFLHTVVQVKQCDQIWAIFHHFGMKLKKSLAIWKGFI